MKTMFKRALLASLLAGAGFAVFAQGMGGPMGGMGGPMGGGPCAGMQRGMHQPNTARMQEMRTQHLAALKTRLKITPEQEGAWSAFTQSMTPPAGMWQRPDPVEMDKLTTPERIDKMRALRSEHQAAMDKHADAIKTFYAALTAEQKKVFDAEHTRQPRKGGMRGMRGDAPPPAK